jgi:hypothetical protein
MKKTLLTILAFTGITALYAQVPKTPMIEHFTQASCGPCASQNPQLKSTLEAFGTSNYVRVSHQTSWPGTDPMNAQFPAGPGARVNYYGFNGVPATSLNGGATDFPNTVVTSSTLAASANQTTPYSISATQTWINPSEISVNIDVENVTGTAISSANKIYVTMVENEVNYASAPGSNGETSFEYVMRQMYNASTGAENATTGATLGSIAPNSTTNFNFTITDIPTHIRDKRQISFAIYIQNNSTKVMYQAGKTERNPNISGAILVSASSTTDVGIGYCDYAMIPSIEFTNNDNSAVITEVVTEYVLNGATPIQQVFTGNLTSGQSTTITFPETTMSGGTNVVTSEIISVNGNQYWNSPADISMANKVFQKLNSSGVPAPLFEGMENAELLPNSPLSRDLTTALFDADASISESLFGVLDGPVANLGAIGGFGNSNRSIMFRFYNVQNGEMNLVFQKVNLGTNSTLSFTHNYRQYISENDRLEVLVSTDCGLTWSGVFDKAGTALSTLPASNTAYFPSGTSGWVNNTIDLAAYNGMDDIVIRFKGTSAYGNNLFLDDISVASTLSVDESELAAVIQIYPTNVKEELTVVANENLKAEFYDLLGRKAKQVSITSGEVKINVSDLAPQLYLIRFTNDLGQQTTKKIIVK